MQGQIKAQNSKITLKISENNVYMYLFRYHKKSKNYLFK